MSTCVSLPQKCLTTLLWLSGPKTGSHSHEGAKQGKGIDYTLLGMCSQIQTKLHKDLLQPVIGFSGGHSGRYVVQILLKSILCMPIFS